MKDCKCGKTFAVAEVRCKCDPPRLLVQAKPAANLTERGRTDGEADRASTGVGKPRDSRGAAWAEASDMPAPRSVRPAA